MLRSASAWPQVRRACPSPFTTVAALVKPVRAASGTVPQADGWPHLIIHELGFVPLSKTGAGLLFELISQRYERGATLITSNFPFDEWTRTLGQNVSPALCYRLAQSRARKAG